MKKNSIILSIAAMIAVAFTSCETTPSFYSVKGVVPDSLNGKNVELYTCELKNKKIATTVVENGSFVFTDTLRKPLVALVRIEGKNQCGCVLDEVPVVINYDGKKFQVSGSRRTDAMVAYDKLKEERQRNSKKSILPNPIQMLLSGEVRKITAEEARIEEERDKHNKIVYKAYCDSLKELVKRNTDNVVGAYVFDYLFEGSSMDEDIALQDSILAVAGKEFLETPMAKMVIAAQRRRVGQTFTDFELPDQNGKMHRLSDYVGEGKYVLVDIWASWCLGCRMETPKVKKAYDKYHNRGFEVVMVTRDRKEEDWIKAMEKDGVKDMGIQLKDKPDMLDELLGFKFIPCTMLINPEGKIIANELKQNELEEILSKEIGE